jgi:flagellar motor switch/type III secretory pathway protein FliN
MPDNLPVKTAVTPVLDQFASLSDVTCEVAVVLGTGRMSVRECLYLRPKTVIPLEQMAGSDLHVRINGVLIAHGKWPSWTTAPTSA